MKTIILSSLSPSTSPFSENTTPIVATIGFFDGVHKGHAYIIEEVKRIARREEALSMIVTFDRHPRQVLGDEYQPQLLSTLDEKLLLLSKTSIDIAVVVPFNKETAAMTAQQFMQQVLHQQCGVTHLVIGYDNRFGNGREASYNDYVAYGKELGIEVSTVGAFESRGESISSSVVRRYLLKGEVEMAQQCLGYPYFLTGTVVEGDHEGRRLGFPTANLMPHDVHKLVPANGVYAVKVRLPHSVEMKRGIMNIGTRPTFGKTERTLETHILEYDDDLYGQTLQVFFVHRLREEQTFDNLEMLIQQIEEDKNIASQQFKLDSDDNN